MLSGQAMGASRLTAGPRAREPSLRWRWSRPYHTFLGALPAGAGANAGTLKRQYQEAIYQKATRSESLNLPKLCPLCNT